MSGKTGIQWTDATWNPIRGCSRVSEGCRNCYAEAVAARFSGPGLPYEGLARRRSSGEPQWTGEVHVIESHMMDPLRWQKPRRIFVNSMSDLFHENVSDETIARIFAVMFLAERHTFQALTKRPARMQRLLSDEAFRDAILDAAEPLWDRTSWARDDSRSYEDWCAWVNGDGLDGAMPDNIWLGVSVENQEAANERIPLLLRTPAAIRFLSCEPLLGPLNFRAANGGVGWCRCQGHDLYVHKHYPEPPNRCARCLECDGYVGIDWVIVGGESGARARPCDVAWVRSIVDQCRYGSVAPFVKQLGAHPVDRVRPTDCGHSVREGQPIRWYLNDAHGGDMSEWPEDLRIRELPAIRS